VSRSGSSSEGKRKACRRKRQKMRRLRAKKSGAECRRDRAGTRHLQTLLWRARPTCQRNRGIGSVLNPSRHLWVYLAKTPDVSDGAKEQVEMY
jgi:hypothetical protein